MTQTLSTIIVLAIALLPGSAIAQSTQQANGTVQGVVFVFDKNGGPSVVPSVKVLLTGPAHMEVESDDEGIFAFDSVPPGHYKISAEAPGMTGTRTVLVSPGTLSEVLIQVKLVALAESTTVTGSADPANTKEPWGRTGPANSRQKHANIDDGEPETIPHLCKKVAASSDVCAVTHRCRITDSLHGGTLLWVGLSSEKLCSSAGVEGECGGDE